MPYSIAKFIRSGYLGASEASKSLNPSTQCQVGRTPTNRTKISSTIST